MKVFISSVTHLLKEERRALPPFLKLFDHTPLRFEDFEAQDRSSREACLAGVEAADVYVLLLGPRYGTPFPIPVCLRRRRSSGALVNAGSPSWCSTRPLMRKTNRPRLTSRARSATT
jgi:hypothetical protein